MPNEQETVVVFESPDPTEVSMARGLLEGEGIACVERGLGGTGALKVLAGSMSHGLRTLSVTHELRERALEILGRVMGGETSGESD